MRSPVARPALLLVAAAALLLGGACGRKTPVRPPEAVAPQVILALQVSNAPEGIRLEWPRPRQTEDGETLTDLARFEIERGVGDGPFGVIGHVDVTDRSRLRQARHFRYTDSIVNPGETYRYRVIAYTTDDYESLPSNVVEIVRAAPTTPPTPPAAARQTPAR